MEINSFDDQSCVSEITLECLLCVIGFKLRFPLWSNSGGNLYPQVDVGTFLHGYWMNFMKIKGFVIDVNFYFNYWCCSPIFSFKITALFTDIKMTLLMHSTTKS